MNDDKFERLSDSDMEMISGGTTDTSFTIRNNGSWWKLYEVIDKRGQTIARCFTLNGAEEEQDTLRKLDIYYTIKNKQIQAETYKMLQNEKPVE